MTKIFAITAALLLAACFTPDPGGALDAGADPEPAEKNNPGCGGINTVTCDQWNATHSGCDQHCYGTDQGGCKILRYPGSTHTCGHDTNCESYGCDGAGSCAIPNGIAANGTACIQPGPACGIFSCYAGECTIPECAVGPGGPCESGLAGCSPEICAQEFCE